MFRKVIIHLIFYKNRLEAMDKKRHLEKKIEKKTSKASVNDETETAIDHEKVLEDSFLCAIKFKQKEFKLPVIVSTFMKIMQTCW